MSEVCLSGRLICQNSSESGLVAEHLPLHTELTRAEPGCISFEVAPSDNPLVWLVEERFTNAEAFRNHQARVAGSLWGRVTREIIRDYEVTGLEN
ncbi:putative quinol monooxygenase [Glutamicibacter sp. NPDC087344]|uniref:putative quinol monooxygenase n=1 Tax=Glutamicibacter sp. NPDC087344 TaxID=3363994 RepID=UPI00380EFEDF